MRLTQLFESMIRLPEGLSTDVMEFVYAYVIDFMNTKLGSEDEGLILLDAIDMQPKHPELFKRIKFSHPDNKIMNAKIGLRSYSFKYPISDDDKYINIQMVDANDSYYGGYDDEDNKLTLNMHNLKMLLANDQPKYSFIEYTLKEYANTIEHELMHFIQFKSFSKVDPKQVQHYDSNDESFEEYIKYASSAIELLPTLKSEFNTFKTKIEFLFKTVHTNENDQMQLFRHFIGDNRARTERFTEVLDDFESPILYGLKKHNTSVWKKAINVMLQQYRENF